MRKLGYCLASLLLMVLAGCMPWKTAPPGPIYDVRSAVVVSGPNVSADLLSGVGDRVNAAISKTVRNQVYPRVVLTVRIVSVQKGAGLEKNRNIAQVSIDASSVDDGSVIAVSSFSVTSLSYNPASADQILAEDIAARIRAIFQLSIPRN